MHPQNAPRVSLLTHLTLFMLPTLPTLRSRTLRAVVRVAVLAVTASAAASLCTPVAGAQAAGGTPGPTPAQMTADLLANLALETLTPATANPDAVIPDALDPTAPTAPTAPTDPTAGDAVRPDQYVRAQVLLELALEQTPDDAELWRLRANLSDRLGDRAAQTAALTRYVELRPDDDAIRLRLILIELTDLETLDGRLALLERYLADTDLPGRTPALVSRLASAAAATARELGDDARFIKYLRQAGRQDAANAEAAGLTLAFAESRNAKPEQLAAAAVNLVRADPLNARARRELASRLSGVTAYARATQQYEVSTRLPDATPVSNAELAGWVRAYIGAGELDRASAQLAAWEDFTFGPSTPPAEGAEDTGAAEPTPAPPAATDAPAYVVLLRRVLDGDQGGGPVAFERAVASLKPAADAGDPDAALELAWITALFGSDTQPVAELLRNRDTQDLRYLRASGFVYLREGATDWARRAFDQAADRDPVSAYGLALLSGRDDAGTARQLRKVVATFPDSFGAALANQRLHAQERDVIPSPAGRGVINAMNRLPSSLWAFDTDRNPWVTVRADLDKSRHAQLEPVGAQITMQNLTDLALPLSGNSGDPTAAGPTAVVSVSTYAGGRPTGSAPPIVADLGRRLTLMPGERLTLDLRLDRSRFGLALARLYPSSVTFNSTFIVGPELDARGGFTTGPLGGIDSVRSAQVLIEAPNPENIAGWITRIGAPGGAAPGDDRAYFAALARVGATYPLMQPPNVDAALVGRVVAALNDAFAAGNAQVRAFTLLTLAAEDDARSPFRRLFDLAVRSDDDVVRVAHLAARVTDPLDPALVSALRDGGPRLRRFAQALTDALKQSPLPEGSR